MVNFANLANYYLLRIACACWWSMKNLCRCNHAGKSTSCLQTPGGNLGTLRRKFTAGVEGQWDFFLLCPPACQGHTREKSLPSPPVPAHPQSWFKAFLESSSHGSSHPFSPLFSPPFSSKWTCSPSCYLRIFNVNQFIKPMVLSPGCTLIFPWNFIKTRISGSQ